MIQECAPKIHPHIWQSFLKENQLWITQNLQEKTSLNCPLFHFMHMRIYAHAVDILNYPLFGDIQLFPIFSYQYLWWCLCLQMLSEQRGLRMCGFKGLFGKKGSGTSVFILLFYHPSLPWLFPKLPGIKSYCWCAFSPPLIPFKLLSWLKYLFFLNYSLKTFIFIGFHTSFFLFQVHSWHMEVSGPEVKSKPQVQPIPQL